MTLPNINIDTILSDPMLLVGAGLVVFGLLLFLISLWKLVFTSRRSTKKFVVPEAEEEIIPESAQREPVIEEAPAPEPVVEEEPPVVPEPEPVETRQEKTVVMQPGETEMQLQLDIVVSQLKNLNRKMSEIEERFENMPDTANNVPDAATLKEPPVNVEDYTKKLLQLAEHVIALEKEVSRLKSAGAKSPIMPL